MSNEILVGNTPIFDQLVREMEERGKRYDNMIADGPVDLRPVSNYEAGKPLSSLLKRPVRFEGVRPLHQIIDEMDKVAEYYPNPVENIVSDMFKKVRDAHPDAIIEGMQVHHELDGGMTVTLKGYEPVTSIGEDDDNGMHTIGATDDTPSFMPSVKRLGWLSEGLQEPA